MEQSDLGTFDDGVGGGGAHGISVLKVDYTVEEDDNGEPYPVVHVFGREPDGGLCHLRVLGFRPYFYAPDREIDEDGFDERVTGTEGGYESIDGEDLTRLYTRIPPDVGEVREDYTHYEADILFPNRFRIDKGVRGGVSVGDSLDEGVTTVDVEEVEPVETEAPARNMVLDIEVDDRSGFPEDGEEPVICISTWDSFDEEYHIFVWDVDEGEVDGDYVLHAYGSEEEMLDGFLGYLERTDPDLLSGWNSNDFDLPYLIDRLRRLDGEAEEDLSAGRLGRVGDVWHDDWGGPTVKGRVSFDLLYAYQRMKFTELESYRLDDIAEKELGEEKVAYTGDIGDLWEDDPDKLLEYNKKDVELCVRIDEKVGIVDFFRELARFVGCSLEDATTPSDVVDIYVLRKAHGEFALPSRRGGAGDAEEYEGGEVFEPITGIRENVAVLDLACFSGDTEVVTPEGVKGIEDVSVGDEVYTLDPDTFEVETDEVVETHRYDNEYGELHHVSGNTHDFKITENHRFLVSNKRGWDSQSPEDFRFAEYRDIPRSDRFAFPNHSPMSGDEREMFEFWREVDGGYAVIYSDRDLRSVRHELPEEGCSSMELAHGSSGGLRLEKTGKYLVPIETYRRHREAVEEAATDVVLKYGRGHRDVPATFEMDDWLRLVGWYVTEGSVYDGGVGSHRVTVHQQGEERDEIRSLLERMDLNHSADDRGLNLSNRLLLDWLTDNCGGGSGEKRLPEFVFDLDASHLRVLLDTLIKGDGTPSERTGNVDKFWTKSDRLKDDVVRLGVRCGHKPTVKRQDDGTWYVSFGKRGSFNKSVNASTEEHDGEVYCLTAEENHVVLAGREGKFQWVGQSLYPMSMISINASPETKVGDDYDGETYVVDVPGEDEVRFRKEPTGLTKEIVTELLEERDEKKRLRDEHDIGSEAYEKYDNQQNAIKVVMNCFDGDTDVVGEDGVRPIDEVDVGDSLYTIDPDTGEVETKRVVETQEYEYDGEMVDIDTRYVDLSVTPNHRMLVDVGGEGETGFVEAGDLNRYTDYRIPTGEAVGGREPETFSLLEEGEAETAYLYTDGHGAEYRSAVGEASEGLMYESNRRAYSCGPEYVVENPEVAAETDEVLVQRGPNHSSVPAEYRMRDWLRFVGWYVSEGSVYETQPKEYGDTRRGRSKKVQLGQLDEEGRDRITSLLERMGLNPLEEARQISLCNSVIADWLVENCGSGSAEKRLPGFVFGLDASLLEHLFDALIEGDGDTHSGIRYSTKSDRLKDDMVRLAVHLGYKPMVNRDSGFWRIRFSDNEGCFRMHRNGGTSESDGKVYCVTVEDNHTVLAGRNGKFQWVGQSYYGVAGYSRFRLYDREMGRAVTATGRAVIEHTRDLVEEEGYEVVYGDSVTGDRPVVLRDPEGRVRVLPIGEVFERASERATVAEDGGKERRSLDGWEALSVSGDYESEWRPVEGIVRHETDKDIVRLQHKFGESMTTRDHSYVVDEGDGLRERAPDDVEEPLRVPDLPGVDGVETIDVYEEIRGYEREYVDGRSNGRERTKRVHTDGEYVWFGHEEGGDRDSTVKVRRYLEVGTDGCRSLLRLLGRYVADGSASTEKTSSGKYGASIASDEVDELETLRRDYDRLFENATATVTASDHRDERTVSYPTQEGESTVTYNDTTRKLQMMNELSAVLFREFAGQRSRGKRVPGVVYHLPPDEQEVFIDALVRGDGSREFPRYSDGYAERNFDFETASRRLAAGLSTLLIQRGERHSFKYRDEKGSYTVRTCDYYREGRAPVVEEVDHDGYVYDLSVEENENFVDGVGGVVLHNTDSTLVELGDGDLDELVRRGEALEDEVNGSYDSFAVEEFNAESHRWEIEFEKLYRRFFQAGRKKRYAGSLVWKEGQEVDDLDITGFEYKRSDVAPITKDVQEEVIRRILDGAGFDEVSGYVQEVVERFKRGEYGYDDVGIPGGIGKKLDSYDTDTAQVTGAKYANEHLGTNFTSGSKPKRLYVKRVNGDLPPTDVVCFEYPEQIPDDIEIDWDKMLEKTVQAPIERILEALGWSWSEVVSGQRQQGLGSFT